MHDRYRNGPARLAAAGLLATAALLLTFASPVAADVPIDERRYTIQVERFKALQESIDQGGDVFASDEIYAGFQTTIFGTNSTAVQTRLIGDFDTGESKALANDQNCLSPADVRVDNGAQYLSGFSNDRWVCAAVGNVAPFTITSRVLESDTGGCQAPCNPDVLKSAVLDKRGSNDDDLGSRSINFSREGLANDFINPGESRRYTVNHRPSGNNAGNYDVTYKVTRVA